jgi:hypothetical protein
MHTYHTEAIVSNEGKIELTLLPFTKGEKVAVVIMPYKEAQEAIEADAWDRIALENFFKDDSEGDSAYDKL